MSKKQAFSPFSSARRRGLRNVRENPSDSLSTDCVGIDFIAFAATLRAAAHGFRRASFRSTTACAGSCRVMPPCGRRENAPLRTATASLRRRGLRNVRSNTPHCCSRTASLLLSVSQPLRWVAIRYGRASRGVLRYAALRAAGTATPRRTLRAKCFSRRTLVGVDFIAFAETLSHFCSRISSRLLSTTQPLRWVAPWYTALRAGEAVLFCAAELHKTLRGYAPGVRLIFFLAESFSTVSGEKPAFRRMLIIHARALPVKKASSSSFPQLVRQNTAFPALLKRNKSN